MRLFFSVGPYLVHQIPWQALLPHTRHVSPARSLSKQPSHVLRRILASAMQESYRLAADFQQQFFQRQFIESGWKGLQGSFLPVPVQEENATLWSGSFLEKARLYRHLGLAGKADMKGTMSGDQDSSSGLKLQIGRHSQLSLGIWFPCRARLSSM